jgi:hypothetical protein
MNFKEVFGCSLLLNRAPGAGGVAAHFSGVGQIDLHTLRRAERRGGDLNKT